MDEDAVDSARMEAMPCRIKIENVLEDDYEEEDEESCDFKYSYYLGEDNEQEIRERTGDGDEQNEDYMDPLLDGNYIKSEPKSHQEEEEQFGTEYSNSPYSEDEDNSKDLDWELSSDCSEAIKKNKLKLGKRGRNSSDDANKKQATKFRRLVQPAESGRVLNAFQNIVQNLSLKEKTTPTKKKGVRKIGLKKTGNIQSTHATNSLPTLKSTESGQETKKIQKTCGLCNKGFFTTMAYNKHLTRIHKVVPSTHPSTTTTSSFDQVQLVVQTSSAIMTTSGDSDSICIICKQQFLSSQDLVDHRHQCRTNTADTNKTSSTATTSSDESVEIFPLMMVQTEHMSSREDLFHSQQLQPEADNEPMELQDILSSVSVIPEPLKKSSSLIVPPNPHRTKQSKLDPLGENHVCGECFGTFSSKLLLQRHIRSTHVKITNMGRQITDSFTKIFLKRN